MVWPQKAAAPIFLPKWLRKNPISLKWVGAIRVIQVLRQAKAGDLNLWGRNKSLHFGGHISEVGHRLELDFSEPRLFNHPARATLSTFWERKTDFNQIFGTEAIGASLGVKRTYWSDLVVGLKLHMSTGISS